jgi:hypothetical protein
MKTTGVMSDETGLVNDETRMEIDKTFNPCLHVYYNGIV